MYFLFTKISSNKFTLILILTFLSDSNCCQINESNLEDPKEIPIQKEDFGDENCVQS